MPYEPEYGDRVKVPGGLGTVRHFGYWPSARGKPRRLVSVLVQLDSDPDGQPYFDAKDVKPTVSTRIIHELRRRRLPTN